MIAGVLTKVMTMLPGPGPWLTQAGAAMEQPLDCPAKDPLPRRPPPNRMALAWRKRRRIEARSQTE